MISPPKPDEIEISVFGRGYGESILIHATHNNWFIIDSCINPTTKRPAVLEYLENIGVDPSVAVKQIIATHWHRDHIRGLGDVYKACTSAEFVCSVALNCREFMTLVQTYQNNIMAKDTGIDEFQIIVNEFVRRDKLPVFAKANTLLWRSVIKDSHECSIYSLSPSDRAIIATLIDIQNGQAIKNDAKRRVIATSPNHTAIVLWISIGEYSILLGADLENTSDTKSGWTAIVNSELRPEGKANYFKIPHHGSQNAHEIKVWQNMIDEDHVSVLSPFQKGNKSLPTKADVTRICSLSDKSFSTSSFKQTKVKRGKSVEKMIKETVKNIRLANPSFGQVRNRVSSDKTTIDLFLDATTLKEIYS